MNPRPAAPATRYARAPGTVLGGLLLALACAAPASASDPPPLSQRGRLATHKGVLLQALLDRAGLVDASGGKTRLQHVILARGSDGYAVALSLGELDPELEGKKMLVAYQKDGAPLDGLRLVVPDDKQPARAVRELVSIEVR